MFTGSWDGVASLLLPHLRQQCFRFNFDIFNDYSVILTPEEWSIESPAGLKISSNNATCGFWWKAFNYNLEGDVYVSEEVKYIFREIYSWFVVRGKIKGNPPDFHRKYGKIYLLKIASEYFLIPETVVGWGKAINSYNYSPLTSYAAKSLGSGLTTKSKALFTTEINTKKLDITYPWYLQCKVEAESDVTVFICGAKIFFFERSRMGLKGLDWRNQDDVLSDNQHWFPFAATMEDFNKVKQFISKIGVNWGRIDFLWTGADLVFLEYNANGQFMFLDEKDEYGLLDATVEYLSEKSN
jgi:hypothetical protein